LRKGSLILTASLRFSIWRAWLAIAEQADKNSQTTPVYETPEPRRHVVQQQQQPQPKKE
jgi:hypothetical protein